MQKPAHRLAPLPEQRASHPLASLFVRYRYPALLFLFTIAVFWKLIFSKEYTLLVYPDSSFQTYPWAQYLSEALHRSSFPFWDMYTDAGRSFIGEMQTGAFYPPNLLMGLLPRNARGLVPVSLIEGFVILHAFLAALFMYGLARHLGLSRFSAFVAGITFASCGSVGLRAFAQVNLFYASVWVPAVFWLHARSLRQCEPVRQILFANLAGLALALTLLAGHHQPFIYCSLAIAGVSIALWLRSRKQGNESLCTPLVIFRQTLLLFVFAIAYASLQLLPSLEYSGLGYRWVDSVNPTLISQRVPYSIAGSDNALPPHGLVLLLFPYLTGVENSPYFGILPLLFVLCSLLSFKRHYMVRLAFGLALLATLLALGGYSPLHGLAYAVIPGFDKGREASRILLIAHLGLSILVGFGCRGFLAASPKHGRKARTQAILAFTALSSIVCLVVFAAYFYQAQTLSQEPNYATPGFACLLLAAVSAVGLARAFGFARVKALQVAIGLILLFDFHFLLAPHIRLKSGFDRKENFEPRQYYKHDEVIQFLQSNSGPFRVAIRDDSYPQNSGQVFKFETIDGYGATSLKQFSDFRAAAQSPGDVIADLMNVRYVVSQKGLDLPRVFQGERAAVYENPGFLPRAWLAARVEVKNAAGQILPLLRLPAFDPYGVAYVDQPVGNLTALMSAPGSGPSTATNTADRDTVVFGRMSPNRFRVETQSPAPRLLIVSQNWYPGWKARVNGQPQPVERVNGMLMGVPVGAGASQVEFSYRPTGFFCTLAAALAAAAVAVGCGLQLRARSRRETLTMRHE